MMKPLMKLVAGSVVTLSLAACGGAGGSSRLAELRVVHASSNAPDVNVELNGFETISALGFGSASDYRVVPPTEYTVTVDAITPGGTVEVIKAQVELAGDQETTIVALGNVGGAGDLALGPLVVTAPDADPEDDEVRVQVVHGSAAAAAAGPLDVYLTAPGADLADARVQPVGTFSFRESLGPVTVGEGDYRIRVTPAGAAGTVVFDSGPVALTGGSDLLITAIDNVGPANGPRQSPVRLLVARDGVGVLRGRDDEDDEDHDEDEDEDDDEARRDARGLDRDDDHDEARRDARGLDRDDDDDRGGNGTFVLLDAGAGAQLGAAHLSANTPAVNVVLNGDFADPVASGLSFPSVSAYLDVVPAGTYDIDLAATAAPTTSAIGVDGVALAAGKRFTAYAVGVLSGSPALELVLGEDDIRSVATEARLRVVHAATGAVGVTGPNGEVDVYLVADGTAAGDLAGLEPTIADFSYKDVTAFLSVAADDYDVFVTAPGSSVPVIGPVDLTLANGDVATAIARDAAGGFAILPVDETAR